MSFSFFIFQMAISIVMFYNFTYFAFYRFYIRSEHDHDK